MSLFWIFHMMYLFLYPIYFSKNIFSEAKGQDKSIRLAWTDLLLIPIWNFERKLKIMLSLYYLLHLFHILAINCCSKFQLIRNLYFLKGNSIFYNFYRNREIQISMFSRPKMWFKLLLKIVTSFEPFLNFSHDVFVSLSNLFFKKSFFWSKGAG